jgi:hypothetical protein
MITNFHVVNGQLSAHFGVNGFDDFFFERATPHIRLVGHHNEQKASLFEFRTRGGDIGKNFKFFQVPGGIRFAVTLQRPVDDPIAVEKNGADQLR